MDSEVVNKSAKFPSDKDAVNKVPRFSVLELQLY